MTINTEIRKAGPFVGDGLNIDYPFHFMVFKPDDLFVIRLDGDDLVYGLEEIELKLDADYHVRLNFDQESNPGGTVTLNAPLPQGSKLVITSDLPNLQTTDLINQGGFYPEVLEDSLDRAEIQIQQLAEQVDMAVKLPIFSDADPILPYPDPNHLIGWDEDGKKLENIDPDALTVISVGSNEKGVNAKDFGAVGDGVTIDSDALQRALDTRENVYVPPGVYVIDRPLIVHGNQSLVGAGCDKWNFPGFGNSIPYSMTRGTTFLAKGECKEFITVRGVSNMDMSGGVVDNPDSKHDGENQYKLLDFTNGDGTSESPATPKLLKVAIATETGAHNVVLKDFRVQLNFNGVDGYNDTTTEGLGDDWDIGLLIDNTSFSLIEGVQSVGYWRMTALAHINSLTGSNVAEATFNVISRCHFQGYHGLVFRGPDAIQILASTLGTVTVPYSVSRTIGNTGSLWYSRNGRIVNYTGATVSGDQMTLTGVSGGIVFDVGRFFYTNLPNIGVAGTAVRDCAVTGLSHTSNKSAYSLGFDSPSSALEVSGSPVRDIEFINCHFFDTDVQFHMVSADDISFIGCFWEPDGSSDNPVRGARFIAQGPLGAGFGEYPVEGPSRITIDASSEINPQVDMYPYVRFNPDGRFTSSIGLFRPQSFLNLSRTNAPGGTPIIASSYMQPTTFFVTGNAPNGSPPAIRFRDKNYRDIFWCDGIINKMLGFSLNVCSNDTANTNRNWLLEIPNYSSTMTSMAMLFPVMTETSAILNIGGGSTNRTAATEIRFFTGTLGTIGGTAALRIFQNGDVFPGRDNVQSLGISARRWAQVFAGTGQISTSDASLKTIRGEINDAEDRAWGNIRTIVFKFNDAIAEKGEDARLHCGFAAQEIEAAFAAEGLDVTDYALFCYDDDGTDEPTLSLRYNECLCFEGAWLKNRLNEVNTSISNLNSEYDEITETIIPGAVASAKSYTDTTAANYIPLAGGITTGTIRLNTSVNDVPGFSAYMNNSDTRTTGNIAAHWGGSRAQEFFGVLTPELESAFGEREAYSGAQTISYYNSFNCRPSATDPLNFTRTTSATGATSGCWLKTGGRRGTFRYYGAAPGATGSDIAPSDWVLRRVERPDGTDSHNKTGSTWLHPGAAAPGGFLICNGQVISRTSYPELFAVIGESFGAGDGSTTYAIPDLSSTAPTGFIYVIQYL